ncbi:Oligoxyloglucan reducing end-specific cellobiohydrolase [Trametopsis cervina]|nr:Oligoxyloglucan reducing end-specific cellobiohydrolase [Trametopsis cervina]
MWRPNVLLCFAASSLAAAQAISTQSYKWKNVKIGGGGGFVPGIVFNPTQKGLAYARTDIGGAYRLNADDTWTPLLDFADNARWNYWGTDALATDPVDPNRLYLATGMYTNSWDPNNGNILISKDQGKTFTASPLPFKVGGNMPGRGLGERLAVDPHSNNILYFGARSGHGLWKSTNFGTTWTQVTSLPSAGTYAPDPSDTSGINSDKTGITFVTFDSTAGTAGHATPRVFVGVADIGKDNIYVSNDAGATWSTIPGFNNSWIAHKAVLSPKEKILYLSTSDGEGPNDGSIGGVYKYNITSGTVTNISPVSGSDLSFGFGGLAVDLQKPGTIMVAAVNSWWPDGQIWRSTDGGQTWSPFWAWQAYPVLNRYYTYDDSLAPWIGPDYTITTLDKQLGWWIEALSIDPFDSNHWLYGTGVTIYGGRDLTKWDTVHNVTLKSLADGIEEDAIQGLISPPAEAHLLSAVGDNGGFVHNDLDKAPQTNFAPVWTTSVDLDFAGNQPLTVVRIGNSNGSVTHDSSSQIALSTDGGVTWPQTPSGSGNLNSGKIALSANGDSILWSSGNSGVLVSKNSAAFTAVSSLPFGSVIASDKKNTTVFYAASGSKFYLSTDGAQTFAVVGNLSTSTSPAKIVVNPKTSGDVWVSTDKGLFHSTNSGTTFTPISAITQAWSIALGAPESTNSYPAIFAAANLQGSGAGIGYYRSDNGGKNWVKINDASHGFGSITGNPLTADPRIYGRVYIGTNGR